jgi:hypothetical protein
MEGIMAWKRDSEYWKNRIKTEHPAIFAKLENGAIKSVRAAAIEAGLIRERTALMDLKRAWTKASAKERKAFLADVTS